MPKERKYVSCGVLRMLSHNALFLINEASEIFARYEKGLLGVLIKGLSAEEAFELCEEWSEE